MKCENCTYQEVGTGKVKGYIKISECASCQSAREAQETQAIKDNRIFEIQTRLKELDEKSIRALRAGTSEDYNYLADYEAEAIELRAELATLQ